MKIPITCASLALALALTLSGGMADAKIHRSRWVPQQFQRLHPCPANGSRWKKCPGWIKDHIVPLCAGGADNVDNMQWQTVEDAKIKDHEERKQCRLQRKPQAR